MPAISLTLLCRFILSNGAPIFSFKWQYAQFLLLNNFSPCIGLPGYIRFLFFFPGVLIDSMYAARLANSFPLKTGILIFDAFCFLCISAAWFHIRSEEHTSELQSRQY